jgi:pilus assembly protein CpaB
MRILIIGLVVLALSVAGISTYLIQNFSTPEAIQALEEKAEPIKMQILVATKPLNPGDILNSDTVAWRPWPKDSVSEHYISVEKDDQKEERFKEVNEATVRRPLQAGEPIIAAKYFKADAPGFLAGVLDKGMRAVSIPIGANNGVSGFILPGDHVDILIVHDRGKEAIRQATPKQQNAVGAEQAVKPLVVMSSMTETILENIVVLAVDQALAQGEGNVMPAKTLTFQLTPKQTEILLTARATGQLSVILRDITASLDKPEGRVGSFTTDVEMSPFLRDLNRGIANQGEEKKKLDQELIAKKTAEEAKRQAALAEKAAQKAAEKAAQKAAEKAALPRKTVKAAPKKAKAVAKKNTSVIQIYRGKAAKTEEINVK